MAQTKTNGQTTPKAPSLGGSGGHKAGHANVAAGKGSAKRASSGKMSSGGPKLGTTYGNHNVAHPC